jgi:hypothetical protein
MKSLTTEQKQNLVEIIKDEYGNRTAPARSLGVGERLFPKTSAW